MKNHFLNILAFICKIYRFLKFEEKNISENAYTFRNGVDFFKN